MLKNIYIVFIGILIAILVGTGIAAFYEAPSRPQAPLPSSYKQQPTAADLAAQDQFDRAMRNYEENMKRYNRNVSAIAIVLSVIFVVTGLLLGRRIAVLADGVLLGGVFTLLYALGRGFAAQSSRYSFLIVLIGLVVSLIVGYVRLFRKPPDGPRRIVVSEG